MGKQDKEHIDDFWSWDEIFSSDLKQDKLSRKQKIMKLLLTTELKNKHLWKPLREAKTDLIRNFKNGSFESQDVNVLFWIYFHEDKDVFVATHLKKYLWKYTVNIDGISQDNPITLHHYLELLKSIRHELAPLVASLKPLVDTSVAHAHKVVKEEFSEEVFSDYQVQTEAEILRTTIKNTLLSSIKKELSICQCTLERYQQEKNSIGDKFVSGDIFAVIKFAVLGGNLFEHMNDVFHAFSSEQLDQYIDFSSVYHIPISLSLRDFLTIIDQLNFKKNFFKIK